MGRLSFLCPVLAGSLATALTAGAADCDDAAQIDHVIVAAADLEEAIAEVEARAGVRPVVGGAHPGRGTQNALLSLGEGRYLEILAPRADAEATDQVANLRRLEELTPLGWAVSTRDVACTVERLRSQGFEVSEPAPGSREKPDGSRLAWATFAVTEPQVAGAPFFISWSAESTHPSVDSPPGCRLGSLAVVVPEPEALRRLVETCGLEVEVEKGAPARYELTLECPDGHVHLRPD